MNTETHYLGKVCCRFHVNGDVDGIGKTIRRKDNGSCEACVSIKRKEMRERKIKLHGATYAGTPCIRKHLNENGQTIRWSYGGMCVECSKTHKRKYQQSTHGKRKHREYSWKYDGIPTPTSEDPGLCQICNLPNKSGKGLSVDHCHATGLFRGWLCTACNAAIGNLGDSLEGILRAADYLRKNTPAV